MAKVQRMWSQEEVAKLEVMSQRYTTAEMARKLKRSEASVRGKLWLEKISPYLTVDRFSSQYLANLLGVSRKTVTYWIEKWGLVAEKVEGKARPTYRIKRKDFVAFYWAQKDNPRLWAMKKIDPDIVEWLGS